MASRRSSRESERSLLASCARAGLAVDVGANVGLLALIMAAAVGSEGSVLCFEPVPRLAASLRRTLALNGFASRSDVREIALAEAEGAASFHVAEHGPMSSLFALPESTASELIEVQRSTLDSQIPPGTRVDLVKLDVEGAEALVWRGATRIRSENPDTVFLVEWSASHLERAGFEPAAVMAEFRAEGFSPFLIATDDPKGGVSPLAVEPGALEGANLLRRG